MQESSTAAASLATRPVQPNPAAGSRPQYRFHPVSYPRATASIIDHLSAADLLRFRQVSIGTSELTDPTLATHITLTKRGTLAVPSLPGLFPAPFHQFDFWTTDALTNAITVLDLPRPSSTRPLAPPPQAFTALPNVCMIRDAAHGQDEAWLSAAPLTLRWVSFQWGQVPKAIPDVLLERVVYTLKNRPHQSWAQEGYLPETPLQIVIVVDGNWICPEPSHASTCGSVNDNDNASPCGCWECSTRFQEHSELIKNFYYELTLLCATRILRFPAPLPLATMTLVGLADLLDALDKDTRETFEDIQSMMDIVDEDSDGLDPTLDLKKYIRFETLGEYEDRVGTDEFKLQTAPYHWLQS